MRDDGSVRLVRAPAQTARAEGVTVPGGVSPTGRLVAWLLTAALVLPGFAASAGETGAGDVLRATLNNGLRVVIVRNTLAPVVTTAVNYLVGSNEAPAGFPGMAHAQEHMMFRGSRGLSAAQLSYLSALMGGEFDASTQQTMTQYVFTVAAEDLDVALHIEAIRMGGVSDSEAAWRQERGAIEQEVAQDLSNPQYLLFTKLRATLLESTPYAHDALGTKASFDRTTGAMLRKFSGTWYAPNNAILVVVGDVPPDVTLARIKTYFGGLRPKALPRRPSVVLRPVKPRTLFLPTDLPYGLAVAAFRVPGFADPDYPTMRVLADVLGSARGVLQNLVAEGRLLDADFSFSPLPKAGLAFAAGAFAQGQSPSPAYGELVAALRAISAKGVESDLVEAAKLRALSRAEFRKTSIPGLASAWSQALAIEGRQSPGDEVAAIQRVTVADVNRAARRYLDLDHMVTAILTPTPSGKPVEAKAFGGKESFTPPNTKPVSLPAWAESAAARVEVPRSSVHPEVSTLPNGLRLIVQPETVSDTISVIGHVKNRPAVEVPPGHEGVDEVLDALFDFGTESLDRIAYQRALDEIGAGAGAGPDFFVETLAGQFDRAVQLLADNELRPALPEAVFAIARKQVADSVAGRLQSAEYQARRALNAALFPPGDPTLREASVKSVMALTLADVKAYYRRVFRPDLTTIVVIGKVTPEAARATIEKYFGGWTAEGPPPLTELPAVPLNRPAMVRVPNHRRIQDNVTLAETLGLTRFDPDYYALELGNSVLGGAFYATRLYRDLREDAGLVYFVSSAVEAGRTRGLYFVAYGSDPANVSKATAMVVQELATMQTAAVPADELRLAKAILLRSIPLAESSMNRIARGLTARSAAGLPLDEPTRAAARYLALTPEEVKAAFARWVRPEDLVQVTEGPNPR
jgi:zinc protease